MRAFAFLSVISLALAAGTAPAEGMRMPTRVASLNLCTDELLLMLGHPDQIVSVTHLVRQPAESPLWHRALRYRANDGSLLSVAPFRPDLVVTMGGGGRDTMRIAGRLGIQTLDLPFPSSLADVETSVRSLAHALGREQVGRGWLTRLAALKSKAPAKSKSTLWLSGGGQSVASTGPAAQWMRLAGLSQQTIIGDRVSLEHLIARPPHYLLLSQYREDQYSRGQQWLRHPAIRRARSQALATDGRRWTCMGLLLIPEIERLRQAVTP